MKMKTTNLKFITGLIILSLLFILSSCSSTPVIVWHISDVFWLIIGVTIISFLILIQLTPNKKTSKSNDKKLTAQVKQRLLFLWEFSETEVPDQTRSMLEITDLQAQTNKDNSVTVNITLQRPGILIGKHGIVIDWLQKDLSKHLKQPVKFNIIESKLWRYVNEL